MNKTAPSSALYSQNILFFGNGTPLSNAISPSTVNLPKQCRDRPKLRQERRIPSPALYSYSSPFQVLAPPALPKSIKKEEEFSSEVLLPLCLGSLKALQTLHLSEAAKVFYFAPAQIAVRHHRFRSQNIYFLKRSLKRKYTYTHSSTHARTLTQK